MEGSETMSIAAETERFTNNQFNSDTSQLYMEKRRRKEGFDLDIIYNNPKLSEMKRKTRISTHKSILIERSGHFRRMLDSKFKEANQSSIYFEFHVEFIVFKTFIDYLYCGVIELKGGNIFDVYAIAHYTNQTDLIEFCYTYLNNNLNCESLVQILHFDQSNQINRLTADCQTYTENNFNDVVSKSDAALKWPADLFQQVVSSTSIKVKREETVLEMVCKWLDADFEAREHLMERLFEELRFTFMSWPNLKSIFKEGGEYRKIHWKIRAQCAKRFVKFRDMYHVESSRRYYGGLCVLFLGKLGYRLAVFRQQNKVLPIKHLSLPTIKPKRLQFTTMATVDDQLYFSGGTKRSTSNGLVYFNSVHKYDPTEDQWSLAAPMKQARTDHIACTFDKQIYTFGGRNKSNENTAATINCSKKFRPRLLLQNEVYDPSTNQWTVLQDQHPFMKAGSEVRATCMNAAKVGDSIFVLYFTAKEKYYRLLEYQPKINEWTEHPYNECLNDSFHRYEYVREIKAKLFGYGHLLFLVKPNEIVVYNTKSNTYHSRRFQLGVFPKCVTFKALSLAEQAFLYEDHIYVGMYSYSSKEFAVFDPKGLLDAPANEISEQMAQMPEWNMRTLGWEPGLVCMITTID